MTEYIETVIVGGGQAGLSLSYYLTRLGMRHMVLERAAYPGSAWRDQRWDSFTFVTPNWQSRLPGMEYGGDDPDGFLPRREIIAMFDDYVERFRLPIRYGVCVAGIFQNAEAPGYVIHTDGGILEATNVVVATGLYQQPRIPASGAALPATIRQLHSSAYRNPQSLPPGSVLVVGSGQSGCQIAEDLCQSGRKVFLSIGGTGRVPRRYRGRDINWWRAWMGDFDRTVESLTSPRDKFRDHPHLSGTRGGHTLNLHQFARDGVTLLGRFEGAAGNTARFAGDMKTNLARADQIEAETLRAIDNHIRAHELNVPHEDLPQLQDGYDQEIIRELDLQAANVTSVIWATGYTFDFGMVHLPVRDEDGYPIQKRGVTRFPGLYFLGLPWLYKVKSGILFGVGEDAAYLASHIKAATLQHERHALFA